MIETMLKIEIIGLMEELDQVLDLVQEFGAVQIEEIPTVEGTRSSHLRRIHLDESREHLLNTYEELSRTIAELMSTLSEGVGQAPELDADERDRLAAMSPEELLEQVAPAARDIRRLARQRKNLRQDIESTRQYEHLIETFMPLLEKVSEAGDMEQIGIVLRKGETAVLQLLRNRIAEITGPKTTVYHQEMPGGETGVFIITTREDLPQVRSLLGNEGVDEYHIPREFRRDSFRESIEAIHARMEEIPAELERIDERILAAKAKHLPLLMFIRAHAANRLNQLKILSRLVRTRYTFVISGWMPRSRFDGLHARLNDRFGDRVHMGSVRLSDLDYLRIPTLLSNTGPFRAAELLMKLLPPPRYGNIDATPFIGLFFPLFFGIILGDMAYGLVLLAIAGIMKLKASKGSLLSDAGTVALAMGASTTMFGFLFGEFLGNYGAKLGLHALAPWLHRETAVVTILLISLGIGVFHILLGFGLKMYVSLAMKHVKGALEALAKTGVVIGVAAIFAQMLFGLVMPVRYIGYGLTGAGVLGIIMTEGVIGVLEVFSLLGNILSYSRLMAIGLASVILAVVANRLAEASNNIVAAVAIGFIIHFINFVMGVFSPTIHSLRLHYVEFFSKFFSATGTSFEPFKKIGEDFS